MQLCEQLTIYTLRLKGETSAASAFRTVAKPLLFFFSMKKGRPHRPARSTWYLHPEVSEGSLAYHSSRFISPSEIDTGSSLLLQDTMTKWLCFGMIWAGISFRLYSVIRCELKTYSHSMKVGSPRVSLCLWNYMLHKSNLCAKTSLAITISASFLRLKFFSPKFMQALIVYCCYILSICSSFIYYLLSSFQTFLLSVSWNASKGFPSLIVTNPCYSVQCCFSVRKSPQNTLGPTVKNSWSY